MKEHKSIVVWRSAALGDFILSTPAFYEIRKNFPDHKIILLTISGSDAATKAKVEKYSGKNKTPPWVKLAMPHLIDECIQVENPYSIRYLNSLRKVLKEYRIDFSIMMLDPCAPYRGRLKKLLMLFMLTFNPKIFGWKTRGSLNRDRDKLKATGRLKHHVLGPLQFLNEIETVYGYPNLKELKFDLRVDANDFDFADNFFTENGILPEQAIGLAPGSIQEHKAWPKEKYLELAQEILKNREDAAFILFGTPNDHEISDYFLKHASFKFIDLIGKTTIAQSASLFSFIKLVIANDGGAAHLADAMGAKVVSITPGLEFSDSIEPWHNKAYSIRHEVECAPCYSFTNCPAKHNRCMLDIEVETVLDKCLNR